MSIIFLDTNALLKLYIVEKGSSWIRTYVRGEQIVISELALFEAATVLRRRYVDGTLTKIQAIDLFGQINRDSIKYRMVALGGQIQLNRLVSFIFHLPVTLSVRSLDSIHLTAAQIALDDANSRTPPEPFIFVSSDIRLLRVAQAQGLTTENPEDYP